MPDPKMAYCQKGPEPTGGGGGVGRGEGVGRGLGVGVVLTMRDRIDLERRSDRSAFAGAMASRVFRSYLIRLPWASRTGAPY